MSVVMGMKEKTSHSWGASKLLTGSVLTPRSGQVKYCTQAMRRRQKQICLTHCLSVAASCPPSETPPLVEAERFWRVVRGLEFIFVLKHRTQGNGWRDGDESGGGGRGRGALANNCSWLVLIVHRVPGVCEANGGTETLLC